MKLSLRTAFALLCLVACCMGRERPIGEINDLTSVIQSELEAHGKRVLGDDRYSWTTRLEQIVDCRAEFTVRVVDNASEPVVHTNAVTFSLGAINPFDIGPQKSWLELPCLNHETCVATFATCRKTSREGLVTDCATASQPRTPSFSLQLDGDRAAAARLERALQRAVELCRAPAEAGF